MLILRKQIGSPAVSLLDRAVVTLLPAVPKRVVRSISSRYIAGSELEDARRVVAELNADGKLATVDVLGEEVSEESEAAAIAAEYVAALDAFERDDLDANVSIKPTGLGLKLGYELCKRNVEVVIAAAEPTNRFVRIDMEDSSTTDETLRLFRELRAEGHGRVGPVLQASLKRTVADAAGLAGASVRLCKGIYVEPESIQFRDDQAVRTSFIRTLETLLDGECYAAIATHDEWLVDESLRLLRERGLAPDRYEFQMLLGVRSELGDRLVADGHRLRIYVPYGRQWYEYSLRRLQENPKIAGYVAGDLGRSLFRRR
jgi:proline dehydrogenase